MAAEPTIIISDMRILCKTHTSFTRSQGLPLFLFLHLRCHGWLDGRQGIMAFRVVLLDLREVSYLEASVMVVSKTRLCPRERSREHGRIRR